MDLLACMLGLPLLCGMNPYATAFTLGAMRRAGLVQDPVLLGPAFAPFASDGWLFIFGLLGVMHSLADKIPGLDHLNDLVHAVIKPFAGAILALASVQALRVDGALPELVMAAAVCGGAFLALMAHSAKASSRLVVNKLSLGLLAPLVSGAEDVVVVGGSMLAAVSPISFLALATVGIVLAVLLVARMVRGGRKLMGGIAGLFVRRPATAVRTRPRTLAPRTR